MSRIYEAPQLELYGSVTALTSVELKCTPGGDLGLGNVHAHTGGPDFTNTDPHTHDEHTCQPSGG